MKIGPISSCFECVYFWKAPRRDGRVAAIFCVHDSLEKIIELPLDMLDRNHEFYRMIPNACPLDEEN